MLALVQLLSDHTCAMVNRRAAELGIKEKDLPADFAALRKLLFPESAQWTTFKAMEPIAEQLSIYADGERFQTNLLFQSSGDSLVLTDPTAALQFCGEKGYLLTALKTRKDNWKGKLFRKHASGKTFEYALINGEMSAPVNATTTLLQKLYNYALPVGSRSVIAKDLMEGLQELMFRPLLPFMLTDQPSRYAYDRFPQKISFGQAFKLHLYGKKYLQEKIELQLNGGTVDVTVYLFKQELKGMHEQTSKHLIKRTFFKNGMHVIFIDLGLVYAQLGEDFIEFGLGLPMLKNAVLIAVNFMGPVAALTGELKGALGNNEALKRENERRKTDLINN